MAQVFRGDDLATIEFCGSKRALWAQSDRMSAGGTLEELWKSGRQGNLCPLEQVRAIALRDAYTDLPGALPKSGGQAALLSAIAERVTKIGGGHPSKEAIRLLLERYDADPSGWYPVVPLPNFGTAPGEVDEPRAQRPRVGPGPNTPAR